MTDIVDRLDDAQVDAEYRPPVDDQTARVRLRLNGEGFTYALSLEEGLACEVSDEIDLSLGDRFDSKIERAAHLLAEARGEIVGRGCTTYSEEAAAMIVEQTRQTLEKLDRMRDEEAREWKGEATLQAVCFGCHHVGPATSFPTEGDGQTGYWETCPECGSDTVQVVNSRADSTDALDLEGLYLKTTQRIDLYPHCIIPEGARMQVVEASRDLVRCRLEDEYEALDEWDNCWVVTPDMYQDDARLAVWERTEPAEVGQ